MYAVIESGGKQYRVAEGDTLLVDRLPVAEGDAVDLKPVFFRDDEVIADPDELAKVSVAAEVTLASSSGSAITSSSRKKTGFRSTASPSATGRRSTSKVSPSATRYCLPPLSITAYIPL